MQQVVRIWRLEPARGHAITLVSGPSASSPLLCHAVARRRRLLASTPLRLALLVIMPVAAWVEATRRVSISAGHDADINARQSPAPIAHGGRCLAAVTLWFGER
jgi:hypothetical protein